MQVAEVGVGQQIMQSADAMAAAAGFADLSPDSGVVVQNAQAEIVAASAQAQNILGLSLDQMQGRTSQDPRWAAVDEVGQPVPGAQHPAIQALHTGVAVRGSIMGVHRPGSDAPGHHVWLDVSAVPLIHGDDTTPWSVVVVFRPIAGDRLRELELRDSERVYRMIAEHSSDMVAWQLIADSTFLWVSPASRAVLGVDPDELVGRCGTDLIHPEDLDALQRWPQLVIRNGHGPRLTLRMRHADGSYRWIERTAHILPDRQGAPSQMITTQRDVTDRVVAEQARDAAVHLFDVAMEHATIGVAFKANGTTFRVNPALCRMLGRSADELVGKDLADFAGDPDHTGDRGPLAVERGESTHHEDELQFRRPDGTTMWCARTVVALPDESGAATHLLIQLQDITARKEAVARLEKAARTDALTGLPNRAVLEDCLTRALAAARRTTTRVGVLFIDLDDFKQINDTLGHDAGDVLLREVGFRLAGTIRRTDTLVRLGGDEFVIIYEHLADASELDGLATRIRAVLAEPFCISGHAISIAASVGTSSGDSVTARELLTRADEAMYQIKRRRREHLALHATTQANSTTDLCAGSHPPPHRTDPAERSHGTPLPADSEHVSPKVRKVHSTQCALCIGV